MTCLLHVKVHALWVQRSYPVAFPSSSQALIKASYDFKDCNPEIIQGMAWAVEMANYWLLFRLCVMSLRCPLRRIWMGFVSSQHTAFATSCIQSSTSRSLSCRWLSTYIEGVILRKLVPVWIWLQVRQCLVPQGLLPLAGCSLAGLSSAWTKRSQGSFVVGRLSEVIWGWLFSGGWKHVAVVRTVKLESFGWYVTTSGTLLLHRVPVRGVRAIWSWMHSKHDVITPSSPPTQTLPIARMFAASSQHPVLLTICLPLAGRGTFCLHFCDYKSLYACIHLAHHLMKTERLKCRVIYTVPCDSCLRQHHKVLDYSNPTLILQL